MRFNGGILFPSVSLDDCKRAFARWNDHNASRLGAALAFYTLFSLAPLLLFVVAMVAFVFGQQQARDWILQQVAELVGQQGSATIQQLLQHAHRPSSGFFPGLIGVVTLLFGASGVFGELRDGLNIVWDVAARRGSGLKGLAKSRLFSFGMVLAIGFILLVSLMLSTLLATLIRYFSHLMPFPPFLLEAANFVISIYVIAGLFTLIFKYVPDTAIAWREGWSGSIFTAILFTLGKVILGIYLGVASVGSAYGAAGSLVAVVVWVYYSAQIFYYGAEVTWVHALADREDRHLPNLRPTEPKLSKSAGA